MMHASGQENVDCPISDVFARQRVEWDNCGSVALRT